MSVNDADRNICVIRVALWALNPAAITLGYPDLCSSPQPDQNVDSPIKKIQVVYDSEDEISASIVIVLEAYPHRKAASVSVYDQTWRIVTG
jgi:hypothetical protein